MKFKPAYLIIPYLTIENKNLKQLDRILYGVIYYFEKMKEGKCIASNKTLAEFCQSKAGSVQNALNRLEKEKYILRIFKDKKRKVRKEIKAMINFQVSSVDDTVSLTDDTQVSSTDDHISNSNINKSIQSNEEGFFNIFWSKYPKKISKKVAYTVWLKIKPNKSLFDKIINALERVKNSKQWSKDNGQFIPHASTWLNQERWDDDIDSIQNKKKIIYE